MKKKKKEAGKCKVQGEMQEWSTGKARIRISRLRGRKFMIHYKMVAGVTRIKVIWFMGVKEYGDYNMSEARLWWQKAMHLYTVRRLTDDSSKGKKEVVSWENIIFNEAKEPIPGLKETRLMQKTVTSSSSSPGHRSWCSLHLRGGR